MITDNNLDNIDKMPNEHGVESDVMGAVTLTEGELKPQKQGI